MRSIGCFLLVAGGTIGSAWAEEGPLSISFNRDIRPILSDYCFRCHGPDPGQRQANLRFDREESAKAPAESGKSAVVPGKSTESELLGRVLSTDADLKMPPPETGKVLTPAQIDLLKRWIDEGAQWEAHWSLLPIHKHEPPTPPESSKDFVRNPIDAFILEHLARGPLSPAGPADPVTLLRRVSFDLTGLPPTPQEVKAFVASTDPKAYEREVDRLLDSPHFGERMAMVWLDLVRYADSVGYHGDQALSNSPYRDYVIRSFQSNKPFDQFTIEQLAGDLLSHPSTEQLVASGYNRLGMMSAEGGIQDKEYRAKYAAERVRNLGGTWLGMTLGCCECHDHKYDPITSREFYQIEAFFADIDELGFYQQGFSNGNWGPSIPVPSVQEQVRMSQIEASIKQWSRVLETSTPALEQEQKQWEASVRGTAEWVPLKPLTVTADRGTSLQIQADGSILAQGANPATDTYTVTARLPIDGITAFRIEALPDDSLPASGPGRAGNGNFVLSEFSVVYRSEPQGKAQPILFDLSSATHEQTSAAEANPYQKWSVAAAIDSDEKGPTWGWAILPEVGQPQHAVFQTILSIDPAPDAIVTLKLAQNLDNPGHTLGKFRLSVTQAPRPVKASGAGLPPAIRTLLALSPDQRTEAQQQSLAAHYRSIAPSLANARQKKADLEAERDRRMKSLPTALVTRAIEPRTIRVLARGNWMDDTGEIVQPAVPAVFPQPTGEDRRMNRLDLATWVVSPENPLTARVFVNRLWKIYFGRGISRKLDDLGSQGEWPTHPELLDWLASEFVRSGWNVKHVIRLIVTSGAYRMSSTPTPEAYERDPYNDGLARQGRFRLDAELIRDHALAVSGLLDPTIGGKSVFPYQPPGYWSFLNFPMREWKNDTGTSLYRRGLYTHWQRQYLHPSLLAFDAPSREECTAERVRSNTPLQALVLLNDPTYVEAARVLADQLPARPATDHDRLDQLFLLALSRSVRPEEEAVLIPLLEKHRAEFIADASAAKQLSQVGEFKPAPEVSDTERAAWTSVVRAVFNIHAFVTRY